MLAVLEDAIDCYQKFAHSRDPRGEQMFQEAGEWVGSSDRSWLFSFENICDTLEIDAEYVRRGLREWRERGLTARRAQRVVELPTARSGDDDLEKATA